MVERVHVQDPWLKFIQTSQKVVEGRKEKIENTRVRSIDWIGKQLCFWNNDREILVRVVSIRKYSDLYAYLNAEGFDVVLPGIKTFQEAVNAYHEFYSDADIKEAGGMLAVEIELC